LPLPGETGGDWTDQENDLIVADYFVMLYSDVLGQPYSKAEHRRELSKYLPTRAEGAIEFKHQNISAVLLGLGEPWIPGYKPAKNFQMPLVDAVMRWLNSKGDWLIPQSVKNFPHVAAVSEEKPIWIGPPPTLQNAPSPVDPKLLKAIGYKVDVAARDARNRRLGAAGEERALRNEWAVLRAAGRADLAKKVRWTSREDGDGFGFDIASFEPNGTERPIEVKTTNGWERTPFHISQNELNVANDRRDVWCLLRLYDFARDPRAFELRPPLERHVELTPTTFRAEFKGA
jgi:hypothetical protein